jgi:hypothetical protein
MEIGEADAEELSLDLHGEWAEVADQRIGLYHQPRFDPLARNPVTFHCSDGQLLVTNPGSMSEPAIRSESYRPGSLTTMTCLQLEHR